MGTVVIPTKEHLEWADAEIGVIIHQDMQVYSPGWSHWDPETRQYNDNCPPASLFHPSALDTDQWLECACALGAKYAILVAKHCSGFALWPTKAHAYSVESSPWKNGRGDVVAEFIASCRKYGVRPGIYCSCCNNVFLGVHNSKLTGVPTPERWNAYTKTLRIQLEELWSNYGPLFEVWFDGGYLKMDDGGREILEMLQRLQPHAIAYQGHPDFNPCLHWSGNEDGCMLPISYATANSVSDQGDPGVFQYAEAFYGNPGGKYWVPCEADTPNRDAEINGYGGWFWQPGRDSSVFPCSEMMRRYFQTVGRGGNFLVGMPIDNRGLVPEADARQFAAVGREIQAERDALRYRTAGNGTEVELVVPPDTPVNRFCVREDIRRGERLLHYFLQGFDGAEWHTLERRRSCGHKALFRTDTYHFSKYRVKTIEHKPGLLPVLAEFSAGYRK